MTTRLGVYVCRRGAGIVALAAILLAAGFGCSRPTGSNLSLVPARMDLAGSYMANDLGVVSFFGEGTLKSSVNLHKGPVKITIGAIGDPSATPVVAVNLEGRPVGELSLNSPDPRNYVMVADVERSGTTTLALSVSKAWAIINTVSVQQGG